MKVDVREPSDAFGIAEVSGLTPGADEEQATVLRAALAAHAIVCVRMERKLDDIEFQSMVGLFGAIKNPVGRTRDGGELVYSPPRQVVDSGFIMTQELREKLGSMTFGALDDERPGLFETYHCDDTYTEEPAAATVLHARRLPPSGGGPTCFLDMRAAYARLDASRKRELDGLRAVYAYNNEDAFPPRRGARGPAEALVEVSHPLVRTHPVAGTRSLFIDLDRATHIEGMSVEEGRALLRELQEYAEARAPSCQHDWSDHDVLAWDNASVQHKARGNFKLGEPRRFWRYMVAGERPR